jgi:hypothetical protein
MLTAPTRSQGPANACDNVSKRLDRAHDRAGRSSGSVVCRKAPRWNEANRGSERLSWLKRKRGDIDARYDEYISIPSRSGIRFLAIVRVRDERSKRLRDSILRRRVSWPIGSRRPVLIVRRMQQHAEYGSPNREQERRGAGPQAAIGDSF